MYALARSLLFSGGIFLAHIGYILLVSKVKLHSLSGSFRSFADREAKNQRGSFHKNGSGQLPAVVS